MEYVAVPDELLADTEPLRRHMDLAYHHALRLKPKPVKRSGQ
jgi:hypothetical protein